MKENYMYPDAECCVSSANGKPNDVTLSGIHARCKALEEHTKVLLAFTREISNRLQRDNRTDKCIGESGEKTSEPLTIGAIPEISHIIKDVQSNIYDLETALAKINTFI